MFERDDDVDNINRHPFFCLKILLNSLDIFSRNKQIFFLLFILVTFPLSFLLFSVSLSARPIKRHVYYLEALARLSSTRFESQHVWKESRATALSLLRLRFSYFFPSYFLSLIAAITAVSCTHYAVHNKRFGFGTAMSSVRLTWKRPFVTTICIYAVLVLYSQASFFIAVLTGSAPGAIVLAWAIGSSVEVYIMAVLGIGLVVSVLEERFGFDAIRTGWGLMEGKRCSGWFLSGWFVLFSGLIGWRWDMLLMAMDLQDLGKEKKWTALIESWERVGLIGLYGIEMIWSYVVTTVFYCECRKRHVSRTENDNSNVAIV